MLNPNANFVTAISGEKVKLAELYEITLANDVTYYYTSHSKTIVWNNTYVSLAGSISRSPISHRMNLVADAVTISLGNISGDFCDDVQVNILDNAQVTIKRIPWNETYAADMEIILFKGTADIEFDRRDLVLHCHSILDSLNIRVPRNLYESRCSKIIYENRCELIQSDYAYSGVATGGSRSALTDLNRGEVFKVDFDAGDEDNPVEIGDALVGGVAGDGECVNIVYLTTTTGTIWYVENTVQFIDDEVITGGGNTITVNGTPAEDTTFYQLGELEMTGGDNSGLKRMILTQSGDDVSVIVPFPKLIVAGDTYDIFPGCGGEALVCRDRFNNEENFRGYLYIEPLKESIM